MKCWVCGRGREGWLGGWGCEGFFLYAPGRRRGGRILGKGNGNGKAGWVGLLDGVMMGVVRFFRIGSGID